jgi:hypothetical protein
MPVAAATHPCRSTASAGSAIRASSGAASERRRSSSAQWAVCSWLCREDLQAAACDQRGADGVGAHAVLVPGRALHEPEAIGLPADVQAALPPQHSSVRIRDHHDVPGLVSDAGEALTECRQQVGEPRAAPPALQLIDTQRGDPQGGVRVDAVAACPLPRGTNDLARPGRWSPAGQRRRMHPGEHPRVLAGVLASRHSAVELSAHRAPSGRYRPVRTARSGLQTKSR